MAENPNTETIRPIYKLIKGLQTSPRILYDIPLETMSTLEGVLRNILRNMDDHVGSLLCLAIFACLVSSQKLNYDSDYGPQVPTWLQNARHFFGPKRCQKTLDIVSLRVILSCSDNYGNMTTTEAAECVHLAIDICDCAEPEQKEVWAAGNLPNFAKLQEKIMRKGIAYEVQMMVCITNTFHGELSNVSRASFSLYLYIQQRVWIPKCASLATRECYQRTAVCSLKPYLLNLCHAS